MARDKIFNKCLNITVSEVIPSDYQVHSLLEELHTVSEKIKNDSDLLDTTALSDELVTDLMHLAPLLEEAELRWNHARFQHPQGIREWCAVNRDGYEILRDLVTLLREAFEAEDHLLQELDAILHNGETEEVLLEMPRLVSLGHENVELLEKINCSMIRLEEAALIGHELNNLYQANRIMGGIPKNEKILRDKVATYAIRALQEFQLFSNSGSVTE